MVCLPQTESLPASTPLFTCPIFRYTPVCVLAMSAAYIPQHIWTIPLPFSNLASGFLSTTFSLFRESGCMLVSASSFPMLHLMFNLLFIQRQAVQCTIRGLRRQGGVRMGGMGHGMEIADWVS
ncbi:hypothetical protein JAAARDRAFT_669366 [Jaapia argillacea MUCL 33604]|uniref:Uncharacterized protein n=1 Tax=Jaapia argillacea MUCL 33604 TaxID=933084 RepID=A0A067PUI1_9AGAM|nr:hypothetical protein JAAARDRAFT_669366 [Jaapia argillacea MUCL 33604]